MSFNVGDSNSKYVSVFDPSIRLNFSDKVVFAVLRTRRKTGKPKVDKETGEVMLDGQGKEIPERKYNEWEGRFVGEAFEAAKGLKNGTSIDIISGWFDKEENEGRGGRKFVNHFVTISKFALSKTTAAAEVQDDEVPLDAYTPDDKLTAMNGDD